MAEIDQSVLACSYTLNDQSSTLHSPSAILQLQPRIRRPRYYSSRAHGTPMPLLLTTSATPYFLRASDPSLNFFARPCCSILTFGRPPFADHPSVFFSSGDYSTTLLGWLQHSLNFGRILSQPQFTFSLARVCCWVPTILSRYGLLWERIVFCFRVVSAFVCITLILEWAINHYCLFPSSIFFCMYWIYNCSSSLVDVTSLQDPFMSRL